MKIGPINLPQPFCQAGPGRPCSRIGSQFALWIVYVTAIASADHTSRAIPYSGPGAAFRPTAAEPPKRSMRAWRMLASFARESPHRASFTARLPRALRSLDRLHVGYRLPDVDGLNGDRLTLGSSVRIALSTVVPDGEIHYTTDGSAPSMQSAL